MAESMTEKVMRLVGKPTQIRNIAICAHIDHGKTTFTDNLLAGAGMMSEQLAGKQLVMDFHEDEQERGITIDAASVSMVHAFKDDEFLINLIDTPGHVDFGGDVTRAMRAVDGAIVLCCASEGVMPQTETVLRQALRERVKPVLFINKVDRMIKELQLTPEQMQERFVKIIAGVNEFIKENAPEEFKEKWQVNVIDGSVTFGSAVHNWGMSVSYMKEHKISFKEIIDAYQSDDPDNYKILAKKAPVHEVVLDAVIRHLPNPIVAQKYRIPKIWHGDIESEEGKSLMNCDPNGPLFFVVIKVEVDPQAGEISTGRLFSGTMKKGEQVFLNRLGQPARIQQIFIRKGAKREIVDKIPAGNIIGAAGIKAYPGETVSFNKTEPFEQITHIFDPVITKAIEVKKPSDLDKLIKILRMVGKEDPTIKIEINEETGEYLMHGMGELHLEVIEERIRKEKGLDVTTSDPIVVYREAITRVGQEAMGKSPNKHNHLFFTAQPLTPELHDLIKKGEVPEMRMKKRDLEIRQKFIDAGMDTKKADKVKDVFNGNIFVDGTRGIVHINEIMEMVLDMFEDVMKAGPLARDPCLKMLIIMNDCKLHEDAIHRGPAQLYPAVREGIRGAISTAGPLIFEPLQVLRIEAPVEFMGEISKLVSNRRGQLLEMNQVGSLVVAKAKLPVGELFGWSNDLRSGTGGRGSSSLIDQMFEKLPMELQQRVIKKIRERKGLTDNQ
mgnify:CR=1 FL=1|tara:strand:- start:16919 stop:19090 length:2172 start_codon:yes stop_codon:yes gene_type:complete